MHGVSALVGYIVSRPATYIVAVQFFVNDLLYIIIRCLEVYLLEYIVLITLPEYEITVQ
mgnify:CR=1 FL=1